MADTTTALRRSTAALFILSGVIIGIATGCQAGRGRDSGADSLRSRLRTTPPTVSYEEFASDGEMCGTRPEAPTFRSPQAMPSPSDVDAFLEWAAGAHSSQRQGALAALATAAQNPVLVAEYVDRINISREDIADYDAFLVALRVVGQLGDPSAIEPLKHLISSNECPSPAIDPAHPGGHLASSGPIGIMMRAAEILSWIDDQGAKDEVLSIVAEHPCRAVRLAAMSAYREAAAAAGLAGAAADELASVAHADEQELINMPQKTAGMDPADFDDRVQQYYDQHPEELPEGEESESSAADDDTCPPDSEYAPPGH